MKDTCTNLYAESYKTLMKDHKEYLNKWKEMFTDQKIQYC